ncbi:cell envelope biogenesis protein TolA [Rhodoblastus sp.]|uniref:cell envelope biogenesis protein TolA n=1 Tax=Rhodoblastus sp. TaxID=1962975 RepID=UPI003F99E57C
MRFSRSEPGFLVSAAVHLGLLAFLLVHFSHDEKFADATEAIPVETVTDAQFHEIMQGEKTAKLAEKPQADKVAEPSEPKPAPPPPPRPPIPPPPVPPPPPPPRPAPPAKAAPPEPEKQVEREDAETVRPPPRPPKPEKAERKPAPEPPKRPPEKPAPKPPKLDEVAKLLSQSQDKPAPKPKTQNDKPRQSANLDEVAKLLDEKAPDAKFTTGREVSHAAALGARHAAGAHMSPSMADALGALLQEQYKQCWNYLPLTGDKYVAKIRVSYRPDGSLAGQPVLLNPPSDPNFRGLAESALRAVRRCNPLRIPAQYQPYYDQWKDWVVGFDPEILN